MRIFRISNILFLLLATLCGVLLFWTSQAVQEKQDQLADAKKSLTHERETVRVLSVEWDFLNRPQRLEKLASEQLGMELPSAGEMVRAANEIPEPIVVNTDSDYFEEAVMQPVAFAPVPAKAPEPKKETVAPSQAEKQSFDRLIESLNEEGQ